MEKQAADALEGVDVTLERVGACEDTGQPEAVLYAYVEEWSNRRVAARHFLDHGWAAAEGRLRSPDGAYEVNNITSRDADSPDSFVTVQFWEVRRSGSR